MTSDPAAPDADAVYLSFKDSTDDNMHSESVEVRLKILTEKGRKYADVEIPYEGRRYSVTDIQGRTIHSNGTIVPFTGKPFDRLIEKTSEHKYVTKVFSMPDAQPGSIIEYRYDILYDDNLVVGGDWYVERNLYVHNAHFSFVPYKYLDRVEAKGGFANVAYVDVLPKGAQVKQDAMGRFSLDVKDVPAAPDEEYLPPMESFEYRVRFYYTGYHTVDDFWKGEGKAWSKNMDKFATPSGSLTNAARELVGGANTSAEKLQKLYDIVMRMDNTDFSRQRTAEENKAEGVKQVQSAQDVFELKRGSSDELALLFIALARAAGFKAYAMQVTNRDRDLFQQYYLTLRQLDDVIAVVEVDGKEQYFDPGQRYCTYGKLHWKHTMAKGLRQTDHGTVIADTPNMTYQDTQIQRTADLTIDSSGEVKGVVRVILSGAPALRWRQRALETDETAVNSEFEDDLRRLVPAGVEVKVKKIVGLDDYQHFLMAVVDVSGSMGTATAKRVILPCFFFEAGEKPLLSHAKRENPVDLHYPYVSQDRVTLTLPDGEKLEESPQNAAVPLPKSALYNTKVTSDGNKLAVERMMVLGNTLYLAQEYPALKEFMDKVNADDQQHAVLVRAAAGSGQ